MLLGVIKNALVDRSRQLPCLYLGMIECVVHFDQSFPFLIVTCSAFSFSSAPAADVSPPQV